MWKSAPDPDFSKDTVYVQIINDTEDGDENARPFSTAQLVHMMPIFNFNKDTEAEIADPKTGSGTVVKIEKRKYDVNFDRPERMHVYTTTDNQDKYDTLQSVEIFEVKKDSTAWWNGGRKADDKAYYKNTIWVGQQARDWLTRPVSRWKGNTEKIREHNETKHTVRKHIRNQLSEYMTYMFITLCNIAEITPKVRSFVRDRIARIAPGFAREQASGTFESCGKDKDLLGTNTILNLQWNLINWNEFKRNPDDLAEEKDKTTHWVSFKNEAGSAALPAWTFAEDDRVAIFINGEVKFGQVVVPKPVATPRVGDAEPTGSSGE